MNEKEPIFEYLESIAELIPAVLYWTDHNSVFLGGNDICMTAGGRIISPSHVIGKTAYEIYSSLYTKELGSYYKEKFSQVIKTGNSSVDEDVIIHKSGRKLYFSATRSPLRNKAGEIIGLIGVSIDITAEKEAAIVQEEVRKLKHERDLDSVRSEAHKNKIMQEFGVIAAKVAHDISSPLMVANSSVNNLKKKFGDDNHFNLVEQSLSDIRNISGKILTTYREITGNDSKVKLHKVDDGNIKRFVLLSSLLENQIGFKKIEWQNNPCKLELSIDDNARNLFAYISPTEFNRSFSNLLNNACESLGADNRNISVNLCLCSMDSILRGNDKDANWNPCADEANFLLTIRDSGSGIPADKIAQVLSGESTKHEGKGMGLSGAKNYFESISGKLDLNSVVNNGTEIKIELPVAKDPAWFSREISYTSKTRIVVLDDSSTIIMLWQRVLSDLDIPSNYFMNMDGFMNWYDEQQDKENIILFVDYDLGNESFTGLDVVSKVKNIQSYLVTNHSEEAWIQETVKNNNLKMLPKKIIEHLTFKLV